jgi:IclR family acetate operon transcriptional repressor
LSRNTKSAYDQPDRRKDHVETENTPGTTPIDGDTPALRLFSLLEVIARKDQFFSLQSLVEETGLPKPTLHRMLQQLESAGMLQRESRRPPLRARPAPAPPRRGPAAQQHGAWRAPCGAAPAGRGSRRKLQHHGAVGQRSALPRSRGNPGAAALLPASRVARAGTLLGQRQALPGADDAGQRRRLLDQVPLEQYTAHTITDFDALEREIEKVKRDGHAIDNEEFLPGLFCIAVLVPRPGGARTLGIAIQAPVMRVSRDKALQFLPALQRAATAIAAIDAAAIRARRRTGT